MAFADELTSLRSDLAKAGVSVGDLLAAAGVDRSTWTRWKNGTFQPRFDSWAGVRAAADRLIAERRSPKAA